MKILQLNTRDTGGAGLAMLRLHHGLIQRGVSSRVWVKTKHSTTPEVTAYPPTGSLWQKADWFFRKVNNLFSRQYIFFPSTQMLARKPIFQETDIFHFHNLHGNFIAFPALPNITNGKPIVWTLHDMWAFTGHCSYSFGCARWQTGCGQCPDLTIYPSLRQDTTAWLLRKKKQVFDRLNLHIVTPSSWLGTLTRESPVLRQHPLHIIPNGIDTTVFFPHSQTEAREALGLPLDVLLLLFVAEKVGETRKGMHLLKQALMQELAQTKIPFEIMILGNTHTDWLQDIPFPIHSPGYIHDVRLMSRYYAAADAYVLPSLQDNFPNTILESLACGTPCVVYNSGGTPEAVEHGKTGYIAQSGSVEDLARGILTCLQMPKQSTAQVCRQVAERNYTQQAQAEKYHALYDQILSTHAP